MNLLHINLTKDQLNILQSNGTVRSCIVSDGIAYDITIGVETSQEAIYSKLQSAHGTTLLTADECAYLRKLILKDVK